MNLTFDLAIDPQSSLDPNLHGRIRVTAPLTYLAPWLDSNYWRAQHAESRHIEPAPSWMGVKVENAFSEKMPCAEAQVRIVDAEMRLHVMAAGELGKRLEPVQSLPIPLALLRARSFSPDPQQGALAQRRVLIDDAFIRTLSSLVSYRKKQRLGALQATIAARVLDSDGSELPVRETTLTLAPDVWTLTFRNELTGELEVLPTQPVFKTLDGFSNGQHGMQFDSSAPNAHSDQLDHSALRPVLSSLVLSEIYRLKSILEASTMEGVESEIFPITWQDAKGRSMLLQDSNLALRQGTLFFKAVDHQSGREIAAELPLGACLGN